MLSVQFVLISAYEPRRDKTNKMAVRPAKTQISLGIRPVWSESSLCAQWVTKDPSFLHADSEDISPVWSEPSLGADSFCWFCHAVAHIRLYAHLCNFQTESFFFYYLPDKMAFQYLV